MSFHILALCKCQVLLLLLMLICSLKSRWVFHLGDKYHPTFKYFLHNWAGSDTVSSLNHPKLHQNAEDTVMGELSFDSPTAKPTFKRPVHFSKFLGF